MLSAAQTIASAVVPGPSGGDDAPRAAAGRGGCRRPTSPTATIAALGARRRRARDDARRDDRGLPRGHRPGPAARTSRSSPRASRRRCRRTGARVSASADRIAARAVGLRPRWRRPTISSTTGGAARPRGVADLNADGESSGRSSCRSHLSAGPARAGARSPPPSPSATRGSRPAAVPSRACYLSIFLTVTLLILISATWLGLYLAKRITRPVQQLAEGARAIGAGQIRRPPRAGDGRRARVARRGVQHDGGRASDQPREARAVAPGDLERKNIEVDARRRYIETILERVATGVISLDAVGRISTVNGAAERLLGLERRGRGPAGARACSAARICGRCCRWSTPPSARNRAASCRRSRWRATIARFTWPPRRRC